VGEVRVGSSYCQSEHQRRYHSFVNCRPLVARLSYSDDVHKNRISDYILEDLRRDHLSICERQTRALVVGHIHEALATLRPRKSFTGRKVARAFVNMAPGLLLLEMEILEIISDSPNELISA
jgi:hypothetical protein